MSRMMSHEEAFPALAAASIDALDGAERDAVFAHIEQCEICQLELHQLRDTAAFLALSSPLATDTATRSRSRIHAKLMARAVADRGPGAGDRDAELPRTAVQRPPRSRSRSATISVLAWRRAEWVAVAAGILLVVAASALSFVVRERENLKAALKEEIARGQHAATASDSLRLAVMYRDSVIAGLTGKDVAMMTLTSSGTRAPFANMFWDKAHNTWILVAHNMPAPKPGMTYQLWLVTPTAKVSAGTFMPQVGGDAMVRATYALSPDQLKALAVTEEPMGGMPQPTGRMVMAVQTH